MSRYLVRRLAWGIVLLLAITFVTYAVFSLIPYDPGRILYAAGERVTPAALKATDHRLGVDRPFYDQYWSFLTRLVEHGSLGTSFTGRPLGAIIGDTLPVTALLILGGAAFMLVLAVPLGLLSARYPHTAIDRAVLVVSVLGIALHPFVVGVVLKQVFGHTFHTLPTGGYCPMHCSGAPWPWRWFQHMLLPWTTFALFFLPFYVRMIRTRLLESYREPYVLTARAKGASELRVLVRHLLRPISATIVTMFAFDVGVGITAAMYVETVYGLPGLANQALVALGTKEAPGYDLPTMTGIVIVVATSIVVLNILADVVSSRLDPRVKLT